MSRTAGAATAGAAGAATTTLTFTIDGKQVKAERGQTILEAARAAGIGIPTLCHNAAVESYGACRLCVVEVTAYGRSRLVTSCNYEAAEGLEVRTAGERVLASRRMTIELLLARCPDVEALQQLARAYGVTGSRFLRAAEDCILCGLCVRICRERMGVGAADFVGRGASMRVDTPYERRSEVCITCGACTTVCPTHSKRLDKVFPEKLLPKLSEFDMGMRPRTSIYIPFPQALPNTPVIDRKNCVHFANGACGACREVCPARAIDYEQADSTVTVEAGALILSPGFCAFDPLEKPGLSFGLAPNVLSSLQFERLLSASGPYGGNVVRPSDRKVPRRIAFVQCVGSRDDAHPWCSSVCCMYALKEAMIAKEHESGVECTLFYMDIRAHGKGFDAYYDRARALGVRFIRSRPAQVEELADGALRVGCVSEDGAYRSEDFDMVVLSTGLNPPRESAELARRFAIRLDRDGFASTSALDPAATSRPGVFVCGPFGEPKDIPETVVEASGAAADAMVLLAESRGKLVTKVELPPERNVAGEPPRIGVFVCHCGKNIGGYVDVPAVRDYAKRLPDVAFAMDNLYTCSSDAQQIIKERIREHRLNRIVVASCSPRTHEPLFQQTIRETGLNAHLFEMANIRDQDSWVHMECRREATDKAMDLVRMAVAKARLTEPLGSIPLPVTHAALVVGGGLAGMTAALQVADQGFDVFLVEKSSRLGGNAAEVRRTLGGEALSDHVRGLARRVSGHPRITVFLRARLEKVEGFVGNFQTTIRAGAAEPAAVKHGAAILAVGGSESVPSEYLFRRNPNVLTLLELEKRLPAFLAARPETPRTVVMIQCVGSREEEHPYCSRVCCASSVKQAVRIKTESPETNVVVLYREMRTYGLRERWYEEARRLGVIFTRYEADRKPTVREGGDGSLRVTVPDPFLGTDVALAADLLVLASRIEPSPDNEPLSQLFKVPLASTGFFLEAHAKLRPVDFATDGVFVCGMAHYPKDSTETIAQAKAAAGRAVTVISRETVEAEGKTSFVRESRCVGCGACVEVCPYRAIEIDASRRAAKINEAVCKGCGICAATCRSSAIDLRGFRDEQILAVLRTVMNDGPAASGGAA